MFLITGPLEGAEHYFDSFRFWNDGLGIVLNVRVYGAKSACCPSPATTNSRAYCRSNRFAW